MKFSLWMLYDMLKDFSPKAHIHPGQRLKIENARLFTPDMERKDNTIYIGTGADILSDASGKIVCIHMDDYLELETTDIHPVFNTVLNHFEDYQIWYQRVSSAISNGVMLKQVLNIFSEIIPFPIMILDSSQIMLAASENYGLGSLDEMWDAMLTTGSMGTKIIRQYNQVHQKYLQTKSAYERTDAMFPYPSYSQNIYINEEFMGFFCVIIKDQPFTQGYKDLFSVLFECIQRWFSLYADQNEILMKNTMLEELIHHDFTHLERFEQAMNTMDWRKTDTKQIVILNCISNNVNMNLHITKTLNRNYLFLYAVIIQNRIVVLINNTKNSQPDSLELIGSYMKESGYYGGMSNTFTDIHEIPHYYTQAMVALQNGPAQIGKISSCNQFIVPYALEIIRENTNLEICHPALLTLLDYDKKHHTAYYDLLYHYLKNDCSQTHTAQSLNIHRSSVIQKISRIESLTDIDLKDYNTKFHLLLSYEYRK